MIFYNYNCIFRLQPTLCLMTLENIHVKSAHTILINNYPDITIEELTMQMEQYEKLSTHLDVVTAFLKYVNSISHKYFLIEMSEITGFEFILTIENNLESIPIKYFNIQETLNLLGGLHDQ